MSEAVEEGPVTDRLLELTPGRSLSFILLIILIPALLFMAAGITAAEFRAEPAESRFLQSGVQGGSTQIKGGIVMVTIIRKLAFVKLPFLLSITLCAVSAFAAGPHQVITGEELQALMKDGQPVKIVDVREPDEGY